MYENHFHTSMKSNNQSQQAMNQNLVHLLPQLQQYCRYLSQNKWDGEDIAQEVIVKALDRYSQKDEITPALLKRMAYNFWIDTIRKR